MEREEVFKNTFSLNRFQSRGEQLDICSDSTLAASGVLGRPLIRWYSQTAGNLCAYLSYAVSSRLIGGLVTLCGPEPGGWANHVARESTNSTTGSRCWGFGACVRLFCAPNNWLPWNIKPHTRDAIIWWILLGLTGFLKEVYTWPLKAFYQSIHRPWYSIFILIQFNVGPGKVPIIQL